MRKGCALLLVVIAGAVLGASCGAAMNLDKGKDRPPKHYTEDRKSIWMTEWTACWRMPLKRLTTLLEMNVPAELPMQLTARRVAKRAVLFLYETDPETSAAFDGCRNGILWRYYNPHNKH